MLESEVIAVIVMILVYFSDIILKKQNYIIQGHLSLLLLFFCLNEMLSIKYSIS